MFLGDVDEYNRLIEKLLADFEETDDPVIAGQTVKTCCLSADSSPDPNHLSMLIDLALTHEQHEWFSHLSFAKGMAEYRRGETESALRYLKPLESGLFLDEQALAFSYKSMCLYQQQEQTLAREALSIAEQIIQSEAYPQPGDKEFPTNWHDWLAAQLAYHEAVELVR